MNRARAWNALADDMPKMRTRLGRFVAPVVAGFVLTGCNFLESAQQAEAICEVEGMKAGYHPGLEGGDSLAEHFKRRCMVARGWRQRLDTGGRPLGPYVRFLPWE